MEEEDPKVTPTERKEARIRAFHESGKVARLGPLNINITNPPETDTWADFNNYFTPEELRDAKLKQAMADVRRRVEANE